MTDASIEKTAKRIRAARRASHLTQTQVAEKAGVSISYYSQVEQGKINPTSSKLLQITQAIGITPNDVLV